LRAGWRLTDLTWLELNNWIRNPDRASAYSRRLLGEGFEWDLVAHLLAGLHDRLAEANWQRGGGGGAKPKPLPRPGQQDDGTIKFGGSAGRSRMR